MYKFSVSEVTTKNWSFDQDVQFYSEAGIYGVGVWRDKLDQFGFEQGVELLNKSNMQAANLVDSGYFLSKTRSQTRRAIEDVFEAIDQAKALKTDTLLIVTGDVGSFHRSLEEAKEIVIDCLKDIAPSAHSAGVKLAIEPIASRYPGYTFLHDISGTMEIINAVNSPAVGLFFDTDHLYQNEDLFENIQKAGDRIFGVHINDMPASPAPGIDRKILGDGVIPLKNIIHAIHETGYRGFYDVEIMSDQVWNMDYKELLKVLKERFKELTD